MGELSKRLLESIMTSSAPIAPMASSGFQIRYLTPYEQEKKRAKNEAKKKETNTREVSDV
jgi:hypothetical protein